MSKRKKSDNPDQLPLFPDFDFSSKSKENQSKIDILKSDSEKKKTDINDLNNVNLLADQIVVEEKLVPPKK
ncbi:MAG: hypothetical protein ACRC2J_16525 [Microcoleaceae cyanobacterium]